MRSTATTLAVAAGTIVLAGAIAISTLGATNGHSHQALVEHGRYMIKITGCNDCHTVGYAESGGKLDEKTWLTGSSVGWQGAWGTTYPINLRVFMQNLTEEQWLATARNVQALPPMPWFALRDMSDRDLLGIYHYVRSLGPAGDAAPAALPPGVEAKTPVVRIQ